MTRNTRRVTFYGFVAVFVFATPLTILYTLGYSFDWQKLSLMQTGGIYLKSTPGGAHIVLNDKKNGTTPKLISRLLPKEFTITVGKDGFYDWNKKLEVSAGLVSEARNIFLFPKTIKPELRAQNATSTIAEYLSPISEKQKLQQARNTASTTPAWAFKNDNIFYLNQNLVLFRSDLNSIFKEQLSKEGLPPGSYRIITNNSGSRVAVLNYNGDLYLLSAEGIFEKIGDGMKDAKFSSDSKKLLMLSDNEINVLYLNDILIQPYKKAGDKELITRYSQTISDAIFYPNNEYVAFVVGDQVKVIELDGRDHRNTIDLMTAKSPQIYFDQNNDYFYYLAENNLYRFKIES